MHSIRSDIEPIDPSLVPLIVSSSGISQSIQTAIITLLIYDTITTMDKEVKYFWVRQAAACRAFTSGIHLLIYGKKSSPCNPVSLIYFANRYIGILGALSGTARSCLMERGA
ncbi:hypothetical protein DFH11DRAFT_1193971 [Phellopilus nigrolimitatus]|nr:hypothetical protein DFH11DRAFT_1193971 [Phellopilus nigrolimitatus]